MFVLAVVAYLLDEPGRRWAWYDSGCPWLVVWLLVCFAEDVVSQRMLFRRGSCLWDRLGFLFLESLAHPDEFGEGVDAFFVPRIVASLWSGAPSSIRCPCSSCM